MNLTNNGRSSQDVPTDWDRLDDLPTLDPGQGAPPVTPPESDHRDESTIPLIAGSWGDLALILGVAAMTLVALKLAGHGAPFAAAAWALGLAVTWWAVAAATLVTVRRATPGMLMAGMQFERPVPPHRVVWVVIVALVLCATLGIPSAVGRRGWALGGAAGSAVTSTDEPP